jgi:protease-4
VVASIGEVGASGGYYIALAADEIVMEPTSVTGSIGVIIPTLNFATGLEKLGIEARAVTSGPNKDLANPLAPVREGHYEILQNIVHEYYGNFVSLVLRRRPGLNPDAVAQATDGRVMTGDTAAAIGLVDSLGGVREAMRKAMDMAALEHAVLIRYGSKASAPRTAYATGSTAQPLLFDRSVSVFRVDGTPAAALGLKPGVGYYVWVP